MRGGATRTSRHRFEKVKVAAHAHTWTHMTSHVQAQRSPLDVALFVLRRARGLRNPLHAAMALHLDIMLSERWGLLPAAEGAAAGAWERGGGNLRDALESELRAMKAVLDAVVDTQQLEAGQTSVHLGPTRTCSRVVRQHHRGALKPGV